MVEKLPSYVRKKRICDFEHALVVCSMRKCISRFMSILLTLFSHGSLAKLFYHLNKPVMMCLRVNVQCTNCFDLSRNKSDWHFISIFAGHNRPLPCIADCAVSSVRRRYYFQKQSADRATRARASRIILIYLAFH